MLSGHLLDIIHRILDTEISYVFLANKIGEII
jgi:hypothetical protein